MKLYIFIILILVSSVSVYGQKERKFIRQGNRLYKKAVENSDSIKVDSITFAKAEIDYRKALDKKPGDFKSQFNIGNALFKQKKWAESSSQYEQILESSLKEEKGKVWFNYGNSLLGQQKLDESIDAYKNALRNTPTDLEAKYNLEFARMMKKQQEQQQKNQDKNKDNKDQNKDQQNKDQDKKDQNKQDQNKDQQKKDQNKQQQQQQPKISKQNAEQMLKALQNDERQTQEKVKKAEALKAKSSRPDQDW